jgi:hypothetical protein
MASDELLTGPIAPMAVARAKWPLFYQGKMM